MKVSIIHDLKAEELSAIRNEYGGEMPGYVSDQQWAKLFIGEAVQASLVELMYGHLKSRKEA
jgi:hypothetical protein